MGNELPKRKATRLKNFDYSTSSAYFITVCTQDRKPILSEIAREDTTKMVGEGLAPPVNASPTDAGAVIRGVTLSDVVCAFKSLTSRICKQRYGIDKMFQRSYAEHIIRDEEDYMIRAKYISENPRSWYYKHKVI